MTGKDAADRVPEKALRPLDSPICVRSSVHGCLLLLPSPLRPPFAYRRFLGTLFRFSNASRAARTGFGVSGYCLASLYRLTVNQWMPSSSAMAAKVQPFSCSPATLSGTSFMASSSSVTLCVRHLVSRSTNLPLSGRILVRTHKESPIPGRSPVLGVPCARPAALKLRASLSP